MGGGKEVHAYDVVGSTRGLGDLIDVCRRAGAMTTERQVDI